MRALSLFLAALGLTAAAGARAQSLDPTPSTTPPIELDGSIGPGGDVPFDPKTGTWTIDGELGEYRDGNETLFHSFGRFDVPDSQIADFTGMDGTERILARVTWGGRSDIAGQIKSSIPGADFYLINPAGIHFGDDASLSVSGSFYVTSAGRVNLENGAFGASASDPLPDQPADPALKIGPPTSFGFLPTGGGTIDIGVGDDLVGELSVPDGETLALVGGDVEILDNGSLIFGSTRARLALVAAGRGVEVPADLASFDYADVPADVRLGRVTINGAQIPGSLLVRGGTGALKSAAVGVAHDGSASPDFLRAVDIAVRGAPVDLPSDPVGPDAALEITTSSLSASTFGNVPVGDIHLSSAQGQVLISGSDVAASTLGSGRGSAIVVRAPSLKLAGNGQLRTASFDGASGTGGAIDIEVGTLSLETGKDPSDATGQSFQGGLIRSVSDPLGGPGGDIVIRASRIDASDAGFGSNGTSIVAETFGARDAGSIDITTGAISLRDGAQIFSRTSGAGSAGAIRIHDTGTIDSSGRSFDPAGVHEPRAALIESRALRGSTGNAGEVMIGTATLDLSHGASVGTATQGRGNAGNVRVDASERVTLRGDAEGPAFITSDATGAGTLGSGGNVVIDTGLLSLLDGGQITTSTGGTGNAGTVDITADRVEIRGTSGPNQSAIFAKTNQSFTGGTAGGVKITAQGDVQMSDGAVVSVETNNQSAAGSIVIIAGGSLSLSDGAAISANATGNASAPSGSIGITADGGVELSDGAVIEAIAQGSGAAGQVVIHAGPRFEARGGSRVSTDSLEAGGGQILLVASDQILLTDSRIGTSVARGEGTGGDIDIDPELMVVNRSSIVAKADRGNGGRIFITAGTFVVSSGSEISAASEGGGVDGIVVIDSPDAELNSERAEPAQSFLDAAGLLRTSCGASSAQAGSFVVSRVAGLPASPEGPLPAPLWNLVPDAPTGGAAPISDRLDADSLRVAALAGGCEAQGEL
jgi:filamentous hemagglutinin family protein